MANGPDEKTLPLNKKDALADKVANDIHKEVTRHVRELREHEVSKKDVNEILSKGLRRGVDKVNKDLEQ